MAEDQFFLQDSRSYVGNNLMWWSRNGSYTSDLSLARAFSKDEAIRQHDSRETDIPWPVAYVAIGVRPVVDMQYIRPQNGAAEAFYVQVKGRYFGNDVVWLAKDDAEPTSNLSAARVCSPAEVQALGAEPGYMAWPKAYIDAMSRPAVARELVDLKAALADTGIVLKEPAKAVKETYRCCGCGQFMSIQSYYGGPCACGTDNRP